MSSVFAMSPESVHSLLSLAFGFALAGMVASFYQLVTSRPASFTLLNAGPHPSTFAAIPFLILAAPFIIIRNTIRGCEIEDRNFVFAMLATMIAGFWSLMSGTLVIGAIETLGILGA